MLPAVHRVARRGMRYPSKPVTDRANRSLKDLHPQVLTVTQDMRARRLHVSSPSAGPIVFSRSGRLFDVLGPDDGRT